MAKPIILLTSGRHLLPAERGRKQDVIFGIPEAYIRAVEQAGGAPLLAPITADKELIAQLLSLADGLILTGGGDIAPEFLNDEPHPTIGAVDPTRDITELAIIEKALALGLPMLGICRGIQILNVAMGGSLMQNIDSAGPAAVGHWQRSMIPCVHHTIAIEPDTILSRLAGGDSVRVNSYHHQAPGQVAPGLRVSARARDGIIEALEADGPTPILAVQFHPEETAPTDAFSRSLFGWLIDKSSERQSARLPV